MDGTHISIVIPCGEGIIIAIIVCATGALIALGVVGFRIYQGYRSGGAGQEKDHERGES